MDEDLTSPVLVDTLPLVEETTKRRKRGILGAPVGDTPLLFSFTSKELWPDNGKDDDSDEDYTPESRKSPSNKRSKSKPAKQLAVTSTSNSTNVNGDSSTAHSLSTSQIDDYPSISSPSSFSSELSESSLDSTKEKGKHGKRARKSPNAKLTKAKPKAKPKARSKTPKAKVVIFNVNMQVYSHFFLILESHIEIFSKFWPSQSSF